MFTCRNIAAITTFGSFSVYQKAVAFRNADTGGRSHIWIMRKIRHRFFKMDKSKVVNCVSASDSA